MCSNNLPTCLPSLAETCTAQYSCSLLQYLGITGVGLPAGMPQPGGLAALFQSPADAALKDSPREAAVLSSSIPHVVVKTGTIEDVPGGTSSIAVQPSVAATGAGSSGRKCSISREDLASAIVASATNSLPALQKKQESSTAGLVFEVQGAGPGQPPENWEQLFDGLLTQ